MKLAKIFTCIALSFSLFIVGMGFAAVSTDLRLTGFIDFKPTDLYISSVTPEDGVAVSGYSGTLINLTATPGSTMTVSVTNPTGNTYYYLNYTAGDHTLSLSGITIGSPVNSKGTITFTVTFPEEIDHAHAIKFNFTLIPPDNQDSEDSSGGTNATGVIEFVLNHIERGLNSDANKHTFEQWCTKSERVLHCRDNTISGGNLNNEFAAIDAQGVYFTLQWVSESKYDLYLYYATDATAENEDNGVYITVYKQGLIYNSVDELWTAGDSYKGYAKVQSEKNGYGIETATDQNRNSYVVWYGKESDLPDGAIVA